MVDKKKSINEYSNPEIAGALNRLRMEKEALVLMKDLKTRSLPNDKGPYPLYNIPESFSTESSINNGPSIKEMTDDELRDFIQLMSSKNEMISIIQNIRDMNNPRPLNEDGQVYEGISLDTPISDLYHYGILGMRWGVRKSRGKSSRAVPSEDYTTSRKIKKKKTKEMSNDELKKLTTRLNLERNLRDLESSDYQKGLNFVKTLTSAGTTVAGLYALSETPLGKAVISGAKRKLKGG